MSVRIPVLKTYKLFIGGQFPRTESGRYDAYKSPGGKPLANICRGTRKDLRNAVVAARAGLKAWSRANAYLRGQILYRAAEMLEGRSEQFASELRQQGSTAASARREVSAAVDLLVHYAGWTDKFQQLFSSVNPVASSHFNFSTPEPTGVIAAVAPDSSPLLGIVAAIAPLLAGGNSCVALASRTCPLSAITFGEVLHDSDLPAGAANILTGRCTEILPTMATHMDIDGVAYYGGDKEEIHLLQEQAPLNLKRIHIYPADDLSGNPYRIQDFQEIKTTWHPVGY